MISAHQATNTASLLRLLSDPTRLRIIVLLIDEPEGLCVYQIADAINISHSAASHQLAKLEAHNIVECFRHGQTMCYELKKNNTVAQMRSIVDQCNT